jgi:rhodanese-related sulfurtransferase
MESFESISSRVFVEKMNCDELGDAVIVDVRERMEWEYYHLDQAVLIPMNTIPNRLEELPADRKLYIVCAHGVRSVNVCYFLKEQGYTDVVNVEGGMAAIGMLLGFQYD